LPADRAGELPAVLGTMTGLGYLKMDEVPGIPMLNAPPRFIVYARLAKAPANPDVVLLSAAPREVDAAPRSRPSRRHRIEFAAPCAPDLHGNSGGHV